MQVFLAIAAIFWILMAYDCFKRSPRSYGWLLFVVIFNFPAAIIYLLFKRSTNSQRPQRPIVSPEKLAKLANTLKMAEDDAKYIGKAHQYVLLGNALFAMGEFDRALAAYQGALNRETTCSPALYGCAYIEVGQKKFDVALNHLNLLMRNDPEHKRGEVSLLYGKILCATDKWSLAKIHLERDVKYWGHAESWLLLAKIVLYQEGDRATARNYLNTMLSRLKAAPKFHYEQNLHLVQEAEKMLKTIR
jgi:hypothetical protein